MLDHTSSHTAKPHYFIYTRTGFFYDCKSLIPSKVLFYVGCIIVRSVAAENPVLKHSPFYLTAILLCRAGDSIRKCYSINYTQSF